MAHLPVVPSDGMTPTEKVFGRLVCKCQRCSTPAKPTVWLAEGEEDPKRCPRCKSMLWNTPRKQKRGPQPGTKQKPRKPKRPSTRAKRKGK